MQIRAWQASDQLAVGDLLKLLRTPDDPIASYQRTLVALDDEQLCGIGSLWENPLHLARWRLTLQGLPVFWGHSAAAVLERLRMLRPDSRPLQAAVSASDDVQGAFWREQGFSLLMRTRRGVLLPDAAPASVAREFDSATRRVIAAGYRLASLTELGGCEENWRQLARLHDAIYSEGHWWNPVRALPDDEARDLFLQPVELLPDSMVLALQGEQMVAVSSLRRTEDDTQVELGWTGVLVRHAAFRDDLTLVLLGNCLQIAARMNWRVVFEVDEADPTLWSLCARLPLQREPDWLTFAELGE